MRVYDFINDRIETFNADSLYTDEVKKICHNLNMILNDVTENTDYSEYLRDEDISEQIERLYKRLFLELHKHLYIDLSDVVLLLKDFQVNQKIKGERYRDHFYHSIQCFLLGLSLYNVIATAGSVENNTDVLINIFSICMYHDLGYLYLVSNSNSPRINDDIKNRFNCTNSWDKAKKLKEFLCFENINTEIFMQCCFSCKLTDIWKKEIDFTDNDFLRIITDTKFGQKYDLHHSYYSAVLLSRVLRCKQRIVQEFNSSDLQGNILSNNSFDKNEMLFIEAIKNILLHDYKQDRLLSLSKDFWSCFLMLIDEMQTYGRTYQDENLNIKVLNPAFVEFEIDSNGRLKLLKNLYLRSSMNKVYDAHSNKRIFEELKNKIDDCDLHKIFA